MIIINQEFLNVIFKPIIGLGDDDEIVEFYIKNPLVTEEDYKKVIRNILFENFKKLSDENQKKVKIVLNYFLSTDKIDFSRVFYSNLPPFEAPDECKNLFIWIWQEFFGNEKYQILSDEKYKIISDIYEANKF